MQLHYTAHLQAIGYTRRPVPGEWGDDDGYGFFPDEWPVVPDEDDDDDVR